MIRKLLWFLQLALLLAALGVGYVWWQLDRALQQPLQLDQELLLDVPAGSTPGGLLNRLEQQEIISGAFWLRQYWRFNLAKDSLHSGEYRLTPAMSAQSMLDLWRSGEVVQYSLTLVPGWSFRQVRAALQQQSALEQTLTQLSDAQVMSALGAAAEHPEGRFFPDTYRYVKGMRDVDVLQQAYQRLQVVLDEEWQQRDQGLPYKEPYQALIMASLVERETGVPKERAEIAGVFIRRLKIGMLLQTDPTVIYGMGEAYNGRITRADLRRPTPYNTYVNPGLTPTPIALVGREAIHAALHPKDGTSLYFVARGDGTHVFSDTLQEHNKAVREYQLRRRADYRSSPAPSSSN